MADLTTLRQRAAELEAQLRVLHESSTGELRELTPADQRSFDKLLAELGTVRSDIDKHTLILEAAKDPSRVIEPGRAPGVRLKSAGKPWQVRDHRDGDELRGRAVDCLERVGASDAAIERVAAAMEAQSSAPLEGNELAQRLTACSDPAYASAWAKMASDPITGHNRLTSRERGAWDAMLEARAPLAIGTTGTGAALLPTHLDPTVLLTNSGSSNAMRAISRQVVLSEGSTWHGVSSAGVTASFDAEASAVSDDSPTFAQPSIPVHMARAFVMGSAEVFDDALNLEAELARMFADAKDRLEETKFSTGSGTNEPTGVWTTLAATTTSQVVSTTAATIGVVDLNAVYRALPARYRRAGTWVANPVYTLAIKALGTAVSASYSGDLRDPAASRILDLPVAETDDAPTTQTTTALDSELILGDFSRYVVVDRIGASSEFIPHLFDTGTGRPTGQRGVFFRWRTGGAVVDTNAFRLLVDKTSA